MPMDEEQLLQRAIKGDNGAFSKLMEAHENRIFAVALRICGNREDAQDCMQDSMLRIYRTISSFKGQSSFSTWVYRVTVNICLDELRRRKLRNTTSLDNLLDAGWMPSDEQNTPESNTIRAEQRQAIDKAIAALPEDMRVAIVLRDIQGFSYESIAEILDANVGTVKSRISRGRERLRDILSKQTELFDRSNV